MKLRFIIDQAYDAQFTETPADREKLARRYVTDREAMEYSVREYQRSWDLINEDFSRAVESVTGFPFAHEQYECIVSPVHQGISNWDGSNRIVRWWMEHPYAMRRLTAHELILHHHFHLLRSNFSRHALSERQCWALSEIAGFALTSLVPEMQRFWPWDNSGYYTNHNYPEIVPLQERLKEPFLRRGDYTEYALTGIDAVKNENAL